MGTRILRRRTRSRGSRPANPAPARTAAARTANETRTFLLIAAALICPMFLAFLLIGADLRTDLSRTLAIPQASPSVPPVIGWAEIERSAPPKGPAKLLGYMMDGGKFIPEGAVVATFTLMPEAGHLMHPAHLDPDEMIEVQLIPGTSHAYLDRQLVWVTGNLRPFPGKPRRDRAAWLLADAAVQPAQQRDIARWFKL